jgi:hypothetical protein
MTGFNGSLWRRNDYVKTSKILKYTRVLNETPLGNRAIAQMVSRQHPILAARIQTQVRS